MMRAFSCVSSTTTRTTTSGVVSLLLALLLLTVHPQGGVQGALLRHSAQQQQQHEQQHQQHDPSQDGSTHKQQPHRHLLLKTIDQMLDDFQFAKSKLFEQIRQEYSPALFDTLWMENDGKCGGSGTNTTSSPLTCTIARAAFLQGSHNAAVSWHKVVRKFKINILQYLTSGQRQDFVWATAGNTDAAGHGNFFNEQYTMKLHDRARDVLATAGLNFVVRPYGLGGATSAPELAACAKEIYGTDIDIITWDFAMTDGRTHWRIEFFAHRVHILPNHPVMLVLQSGTDPARKELVEHLTDQGLTALRQDEDYLIRKQLLFPDSAALDEAGLAALPEHVRYYRCKWGFETGSPCTAHKFTQNGTCDDRENRNHWHHGWKWHAYHANVYALFLTEAMEEALRELKGDQITAQAATLLERYNAQEMQDFAKFEQEAELMYHHKWNVHDNLTAMELYRDHTYCHTANVPAETRYKGYLFNTTLNDNWFRYNHGNTLKWNRNRFPTSEISLTYIPGNRETKYNCNMTLNIDSKDFFLATGRYDGYQTIEIPNDAEIKAYGDHDIKGVIAVCAAACSFECGASPLLSPDAVRSDHTEFQVNGEDVADVIELENCFLLVRHDGSLHWPKKPGTKKYTIGVKVNTRGKFFRFSSFILW